MTTDLRSRMREALNVFDFNQCFPQSVAWAISLDCDCYHNIRADWRPEVIVGFILVSGGGHILIERLSNVRFESV